MPARTTRTLEKPLSRPRRSPLELLGGRWGLCLLAAAVTALSVYYLAWVAPSLVPVPPGVSVPYPEATRLLEKACAWCGERRVAVALIGAAVVLAGLVLPGRGLRYHLWLAIVLSCALGFTYLSISAPLDRLVDRVKASLPEERPLPDFLPGGAGRK